MLVGVSNLPLSHPKGKCKGLVPVTYNVAILLSSSENLARIPYLYIQVFLDIVHGSVEAKG